MESLRRTHRLWEQTADPDYMAPDYPDADDYAPLCQRAENLTLDGNSDLALSYAWAYLQYCPVGTVKFQKAAVELVNAAAKAGNEQLAERAASLLVSHFLLVEAASVDPRTTVGYDTPEWGEEAAKEQKRHLWMTKGYWPVDTAIGRLQDGVVVSTWTRLLEFATRYMPRHLNDKCERAYSALHQHFLNCGDKEKAELLARNMEIRREEWADRKES